MKTNYAFHVLQLQHAEELEYCRLIREAIRRHISPDVLKSYTLDFWTKRLQQDFREEETKLLPMLKSYESACSYHNLVRLDHELIQRVMEHIVQDGSEVRVYALLAELVEQHARYEEEVILPRLNADYTLMQAV
ncbi:MAG: hypothetical protein C5B52_15260 [Bacteroidetes bacterium]|nr:MAG: hypothetical protein C5B52_15260 [Bacteroidota bacterium]